MDIFNWLKEWAVPLSASATFLLAIAAFSAIWQNYSFRKREQRQRLLNEIIEWAINCLGIITKYPTVHFEQLEDLLVHANVLKARRYAIIEKVENLNKKQSIKTLVDHASKELEDFVQQADEHAIGMGRKQRIKVPSELISIFENLIEQAAKLGIEL